MKDLVDETVSLWRRVPFNWGDHDCLLSLADYGVRLTGTDFARDFRGTYRTEEEARIKIDDAGGSAALIDLSNFERQDDSFAPVRGDIVLVDFKEEFAGICTGPAIAFRLVRGVSEIELRFLSRKIVAVWKVPLCRLLAHS